MLLPKVPKVEINPGPDSNDVAGVNIADDIRECFNPPIYYSTSRMTIGKDIIKDLELEESVDSDDPPLMDHVFTDSSELARIVRPHMIKYYTTDTRYLNDTKTLLKRMRLQEKTNECHIDGGSDLGKDRDTVLSGASCDPGGVYALWTELQTDKGFKEKYHYIDWERLEFLNNNDAFLQIMSVYNLIAPVLALLVPVIICVVPFFIIQTRGLEMNLTEYMGILRTVAARHAIGKIFTSFGSVPISEKIYLIISAGVYILSLYQNTQICKRFYNNLFKIHDNLFQIAGFAQYTMNRMRQFQEDTRKLKTYKRFHREVEGHLKNLGEIRDVIGKIPSFIPSYTKLLDMGAVLKCFYSMYANVDYKRAIAFSFGFIGYLDNMGGIKKHLDARNMNYGKFTNSKIVTSKPPNSGDDMTGIRARGIYYPPLVNSSPVKNDVCIAKDCVITGPNASGKTTILKSVLLSIIFTQQYGCGFYNKLTITPYTHLHCYLNVPDTSGRDSLFQSESRKCKRILDKVAASPPSQRHFCLFDELYSGTNPTEAVKCGFAYLSHLGKAPNLHYILTTHYLDLCDRLKPLKTVCNYRMRVEVGKKGDEEGESSSGILSYTYKIEDGINEVDGGVDVLRQMGYPIEILRTIAI